MLEIKLRCSFAIIINSESFFRRLNYAVKIIKIDENKTFRLQNIKRYGCQNTKFFKSNV